MVSFALRRTLSVFDGGAREVGMSSLAVLWWTVSFLLQLGVVSFICSIFYLEGGVCVVFLALVLPIGKLLLVVVAVQGAPECI